MPDDAAPPSKPCSQCGKCCANEDYMGSLDATGDDVKRWIAEKRWDTLQYVEILGPDDDPWADLWISQETGRDAARCPFVRKITGPIGTLAGSTKRAPRSAATTSRGPRVRSVRTCHRMVSELAFGGFARETPSPAPRHRSNLQAAYPG
jgi:hypothetical protein